MQQRFDIFDLLKAILTESYTYGLTLAFTSSTLFLELFSKIHEILEVTSFKKTL